MQDTLENYQFTLLIGRRTISNLQFSAEIDLLAGSEIELQELTDSYK